MSGDQKIVIEVDGRELEAAPGQMLIEVTDAAGIPIPRFCYHKKLSTAASCRMCLVEVEKAPKPLPACATPVANGMKVYTRSPLALQAQKGTMEFLLINHPLDCPICDQGGECELQDVAMGFGQDISRYSEAKRVVRSDDIGALIATDMTRCIHCTRCVRFGEEIAGVREMGATGRGEHMKIGVYVNHAMTSELSGNIIDLCPVGALTAKPSRYSARAWELMQREGVAAHDGLGSNLYFHVRRDRIMRVVPRENPEVNETWISDRDRFSYTGLYAEDRLAQPMVRKDGQLIEASWHDALVRAAQVLKETPADSLGALVSPSSTLEEMYLVKKLMQGLGCANLDHRVHQNDCTSGAPQPWLGKSFASLAENGATLLVGSSLRKDLPILNHWLRKSVIAGGKVMVLNSLDCEFNYELAGKILCLPLDIANEMACLVSAAGGKVEGWSVEVKPQHQEMVAQLKAADNASVLLGGFAISHPEYSVLAQLATQLAELTGATLGFLAEGSNNLGAAWAGVMPGDGGKSYSQMLSTGLDGLLMVGLEPEFDTANPAALKALMGSSKVVALSGFLTPWLAAHAEVVLPMALFGETSGTLVNMQGDIQSFAGAVKPFESARPGWKVLRVLGNLTDLVGFEFDSSEQVVAAALAENGALTPNNALPATANATKSATTAHGLQRVSSAPAYSVDALVRRAPALQKTPDGWRSGIHISESLASRLSLREADSAILHQDGNSITLPIVVDARVPENCVWLPTSVPGSELLGSGFGAVTLEKA